MFVKHLLTVYARNDGTSNNFNQIQLNAQQRYGNVVTRIIFNVLRAREATWPGTVKFPDLDESQNELLAQLRTELDGEDEHAIDGAYHEVCYSLFAHEHHQYPVSIKQGKFYSPINLCLVFLSLRLDGSFRSASEITTICAALEYAIRATMLFEVETVSQNSGTSSF